LLAAHREAPLMRWRSIRLRYLEAGGVSALSATFFDPLPLVAPAHFRPPADVYETDEALVVRAELAGLSDGDLDVEIYEDALVVSGDRKTLLREGRRFYEVGIRTGPFRLEVPFPRPIDAARVETRYENGIVCVVLPWSGHA
jgi:HSP20 family molecular chaperone IbpA